MVQILPANPSFSSQFGKAIGQGLGSGAQEVMQQRLQKQQQEMQMQKAKEAVMQLGLDPAILNLPEQGQAAYFKSQFAPEKKLTSLQESQKALADERLNALKQNQKLFQGLGEQGQENPQESIETQGNESSQKGGFDISKIPEDKLRKVAAFSGQPGQEGTIGNMAKAELDKREKQKNLTTQEKIQQRKEDILFHKESEKYDDSLLNAKKSADKQLDAIDTSMKAIESGNVRPSSLANIFKGFGQIGMKISNALQNKDEAALLSSIPEFLEGRKELFGVRLSDADLRLLQDKLPDIGKSKEANLQILRIMKKHAELAKLKHKIGTELKKENKGLRKLGYNDIVEERFDNLTKPVKIRNPNTGNIVEIPAYKTSDYLNAGGELINE